MAREKTPEEIQAQLDRREARTAAKDRVRRFASECEDLELKNALYLLVGGNRQPRKAKPKLIQLLKVAFLEEREISEMDIFMKFKIGRPKMKTQIRDMITKSDPEYRMWIELDEASCIYKVVGTGAEVPEGWTGFVPADQEIL